MKRERGEREREREGERVREREREGYTLEGGVAVDVVAEAEALRQVGRGAFDLCVCARACVRVFSCACARA